MAAESVVMSTVQASQNRAHGFFPASTGRRRCSLPPSSAPQSSPAPGAGPNSPLSSPPSPRSPPKTPWSSSPVSDSSGSNGILKPQPQFVGSPAGPSSSPSAALVLLVAWPFTATVSLGLGVAVFSVLAIAINVKNRQRSTLFQIASAFALTSSSLATSLSATGTIAPWCWGLWLLLALQATAGILVVHARLDARIALRSTAPARENYRRAAQISLVVLVCAAVAAAVFHRGIHRARTRCGRHGLRLRSPSPAQPRVSSTPAQVSRPAGAGPLLPLRDPAHHRSLVDAKRSAAKRTELGARSRILTSTHAAQPPPAYDA